MTISFYLTNRFEFLIDKFQSKKKTIEISKLKSKIKNNKIGDEKLLEQQIRDNKENELMLTSPDKEIIQKVHQESKLTEDEQQQNRYPAYKQILDDDKENNQIDKNFQDGLKFSKKPSGKLVNSNSNNNYDSKTNSLVTCPSLIYVVLLISLTNILQVPASELNHKSKQAGVDIQTIENQALVADNSFSNSKFAQSLALNLKVLFDGFLRQYSNRDRWIRVPEPSNALTRLPKRPTSNDGNNSNRRRGRNPFTRVIERISDRIGSRNSIRVHNAFRDLAWRIMSSLSMPTPVIYELRRQNFYSPEDDLRNDSLFNKNTTRTIRSRSLLSKELEAINQLTTSVNLKAQQRSNDDDDGENDSNLESRLRSGLEHLINLSRRSLFGRVIRMPSLFPFKRQEENSHTAEKAASQSSSSVPSSKKGDSSSKTTSTTRRPSAWRRLRKRKDKRKDNRDRQMISINGKKYYVNDDGELKDWNDQGDDT